MAIVTAHKFNGDGSQREFQVGDSILSKSHCRVWVDDLEPDSSTWDLLGSTILFDTAPPATAIENIRIYISNDGTFPNEYTSPSSTEIVETYIQDVITVAGEIGKVISLSGISTEVVALANIVTALSSLFTDKAKLDSLFADKSKLDSLFADKATLDSLFADKATLDSLFADKLTLNGLFASKTAIDSLFVDKAKLDSIFADKATLDSIFTDKTKLNSIFADKATLDSIFNDKSKLDSIFNDKATLDSIFADKTKLNSLFADKTKLDSIFADKATLDSLFTDKAILDSLFTDKATLDSIFADKTGLNAIYTNLTEILDSTNQATAAAASAAAALISEQNSAAILAEPLIKSIGNINSPLIDLPLNNSLAMKQGVGSVTFARASTATYIDRYGVLQTAAIDEPRFEKDGLLHEGNSTNILLHSKYMNSLEAEWGKIGINDVILNATLAPNEVLEASALEENTASGEHRLKYEGNTLAVGVRTLSCHFKMLDRKWVWLQIYSATDGVVHTAYFDIELGELGGVSGDGSTNKIEELANGWYKCSLMANLATSQIDYRVKIGAAITNWDINYDGIEGYRTYMWGSQLEELPFASSYIPTTTTAVTRAAESLALPSLNNFPSSDELSIACDVNMVGFDNFSRFWDTNSLDDNFFFRASASGYRFDNPISDMAWDYNFFGNMVRILCILSPTEVSTYMNGVHKNTLAGTNFLWRAGTNITLGSKDGVNNFLYGHLKNFRVWGRTFNAIEAQIV